MECSKIGQGYCEVKLSLCLEHLVVACFVLFRVRQKQIKYYEFIPFFDFQYEKIIFNCPIDPPTFQLSLRSLRSEHHNADRMDQKVSFFLDCDYDVYELV